MFCWNGIILPSIIFIHTQLCDVIRPLWNSHLQGIVPNAEAEGFPKSLYVLRSVVEEVLRMVNRSNSNFFDFDSML